MADQGNLFSRRDESGTAVQPAPQMPTPIPRWLLIMENVLFILVHLLVGAVAVLLPWLNVWTNEWIKHWPDVTDFISQGWVRGLVSGLGLLNIWIAFSAVIHRRRL